MKKKTPFETAVNYALIALFTYILAIIVLACNSIIAITFKYVHDYVFIASVIQACLIIFFGFVYIFIQNGNSQKLIYNLENNYEDL